MSEMQHLLKESRYSDKAIEYYLNFFVWLGPYRNDHRDDIRRGRRDRRRGNNRISGWDPKAEGTLHLFI